MNNEAAYGIQKGILSLMHLFQIFWRYVLVENFNWYYQLNKLGDFKDEGATPVKVPVTVIPLTVIRVKPLCDYSKLQKQFRYSKRLLRCISYIIYRDFKWWFYNYIWILLSRAGIILSWGISFLILSCYIKWVCAKCILLNWDGILLLSNSRIKLLFY